MSGADVPGLSFYRNRAYDQTTGRWTQEDPIGVAGGLNLYQFNGNNPVSHNDPFGLCPDGSLVCESIEAATTFAGGAVGFIGGGGLGLFQIAATGGIATPAAVATVAAGTIGGAAIGSQLGEAITNVMFSKQPEKEAGQQYEEIQGAQQKLRKQGEGRRIESIKKSKQRDKKELLDEAEDYLRRRGGGEE
jgi:uncharacterized protein RhaS with RHS repeats